MEMDFILKKLASIFQYSHQSLRQKDWAMYYVLLFFPKIDSCLSYSPKFRLEQRLERRISVQFFCPGNTKSAVIELPLEDDKSEKVSN